jgi:multiple sugar transport system substrate-binding protein
MKRICLLIVTSALIVAGCGGSSPSSNGNGTGSTSGSGSGHVHITLWHGYTDQEATAINALTKQFNATHPNITVTPQFYGNSDYALQKVLAAIAGGKPPDISYLYGSWAANIATNPTTVNLAPYLKKDPSWHWNDFWQAARNVTSVNGKIIGVPALIDNLALVYNKKRFAQAGISAPNPNWTWTDFENAALKLTNAAKKQFGWAYVNDASEDTVWRYWAMLWQAGGSILSPDGKQAAFDSPAGVKAMTLLQTLAKHNTIYLDNGSDNYPGVFNSGHIGMLWTGPWDLSQLSGGNQAYGVTTLPADQNHQTISGPDNWVVFNNGSARVNASIAFLKWFTSPPIDLKWATMTGDLPIRASVNKLPGYAAFVKKYPGIGEWVTNLANATQSRPVTTTYPKISTVVGQAVQSVLLGKAEPQQALKQAAQQVNGILSAPS